MKKDKKVVEEKKITAQKIYEDFENPKNILRDFADGRGVFFDRLYFNDDELTEEEREVINNMDQKDLISLYRFMDMKKIAQIHKKLKNNEKYKRTLAMLRQVDFSVINTLRQSAEISLIMRQANFVAKLEALDEGMAEEFRNIIRERLAYNQMQSFDGFAGAFGLGVKAFLELECKYD